MALLDRKGFVTRNHPIGGGVQAFFDLPNGYKLSFINIDIAHAFKFAWEAAVFGPSGKLDYSTPLTSDVEVFMTDAEAEAFLDKAIAWASEVAR